MRVCALEHTGYGFLSLLLDPPSVSFIAKTIGIDLVKISSVPDGRAANHPSSAITLIPPNGRPFPGAALRQFFDRASVLISRLEIEFGKIALRTQHRSTRLNLSNSGRLLHGRAFRSAAAADLWMIASDTLGLGDSGTTQAVGRLKTMLSPIKKLTWLDSERSRQPYLSSFRVYRCASTAA